MKEENIRSHDTMMAMLHYLFNNVGRPGEIQVIRAVNVLVGRRRYLDVDVQGVDGAWRRWRIYIRAQPSREIFGCDIPFQEKRKEELPGSQGSFNKGVRESSRRHPVLIAPLFSPSARRSMIERRYRGWRIYVVWKPRLRTQGNKTMCEISLDGLKAGGDLARVVRRCLQAVAARIRRDRWGPPRPHEERAPGVKLASFLRPEPWPPPGG